MTTAAPAATTTSFAAPGVAPAAPANAADQAVIFEANGRKYTAADAQKKLEHSDAHIVKLETERAEDRRLLKEAQDALVKAVSSKEVLEALAPQPAAPAAPAATPVDTAALADAVRKHIAEEDTAAKQEANWKESTTALTAVLGAKTDARVVEVAAEHGLNVTEMAALARKSPTAFLKFFPEVQPKRPASAATFSSTSNVHGHQQPAHKTSGFAEAKNTRERVAIYTARLKELTGE